MKICGVACAVPANYVKSEGFAATFGQETVTKIVDNTGIKERRIVKYGGCTSDLCTAAAEKLFEQTGIAKDTIDAVIFVTQTPDNFAVPATSCRIQHTLGLSKNVFAVDVSKGCTGYTDGLILSQALIKLGYKKVLLLAGDTLTKTLDSENRGTAMLFGDAASATILKESFDAFHFIAGTDGSGADVIYVPFGYRKNNPIWDSTRGDFFVHIDGPAVYEFTLDRVPTMVQQVLSQSKLSISEVDAFIFHQANNYIMRNLARLMKIPLTKLPVSLDKFANTSSASIPLTMVTRCAELLQAERKIVLVGFGVGLAWSAVVVHWQGNEVLCPLVEVDI